MIRLAIIGSSGGNLYGLGGKDPNKMLGEMMTQTNGTEFEISQIVFVGAKESMDRIKANSQAAFFYLEEAQITNSETMTLDEVNKLAKEADEKLAKAILAGEVNGLIVLSADPLNVNQQSVLAAAKMQIPVSGTGGTSMAHIQKAGCKVILVSGTTGTTNRTRAIAALTSMAKFFKVKYRPVIGAIKEGATSSRIIDRISIRGIMLAAIPGFIAMALALAVSQIPFLTDSMGPVADLLIGALPVLVAVIAAKQVSGLDEVGIVAGVVAGVLSVNAGIIGGIIGGILAGILATIFIKFAIERRIPGTTANIISGGLAGLIVGLVIYFGLAPITLYIGDGIRELINQTLEFSSVLAGTVAGLLIWPAIMGGVYHAAILPIVLIEMEAEGVSFLGAVDMMGLVMVSAGITLGYLLFPRTKADRSIAGPGFLINVGFGTFVEASYPFMFSSKFIMANAIISAGFGGFLVGLLNVKGSAYLPAFVAPFTSNNPLGFVVAMVGALVCAFVLTFVSNVILVKRGKNL